MTFSEKYGFKPVRTVMQSDSMDEPLKNGLWNELYNYYFHRFTRQLPIKQMGYNDSNLIWQIWKDYYKLPVDNIPYYSDKILTIVKSRYFNSKWNEIYDFVLFCSTVFDDAKCNPNFEKIVTKF